MKVLHVPYCFYPDAVGGTEVYVASLAHELQRLGDQAVIAAPGPQALSTVFENIPVRRFAVAPALRSLNALYGAGDRAAAFDFENVLRDEHPDVVHLHALTSAVSPRLAARIRRHRIPIVFTYHTPTVSCPRGTLLRWGKSPCSGELSARHCTACVLQALGLPRLAGQALRFVPDALARSFARSDKAGRVQTALRMPFLLTRREAAFHYFIDQVDRVVAVSAWVRELLMRNQVPAEKIVLCRHGLAETGSALPHAAASLPLRFVFVGRLEPAKGVDLLLRVWRRHPKWQATLDVYGVPVDGQTAYWQALYASALRDSRVRFLAPLAHPELVRALAGYHAVVVPSQGLETGPLVVLEAFGAGVPVIGSRLGGIAEWLEDGRHGRLVDARSESAWAEVFESLLRAPVLLDRWAAGLSTPRTMRAVASEMRDLYQSLIGASA